MPEKKMIRFPPWPIREVWLASRRVGRPWPSGRSRCLADRVVTTPPPWPIREVWLASRRVGRPWPSGRSRCLADRVVAGGDTCFFLGPLSTWAQAPARVNSRPFLLPANSWRSYPRLIFCRLELGHPGHGTNLLAPGPPYAHLFSRRERVRRHEEICVPESSRGGNGRGALPPRVRDRG